MDVLFERLLARAEEYTRLAEQAHDQTVVHEYQELARQWRELAVGLVDPRMSPLSVIASAVTAPPSLMADTVSGGPPAAPGRR